MFIDKMMVFHRRDSKHLGDIGNDTEFEFIEEKMQNKVESIIDINILEGITKDRVGF